VFYLNASNYTLDINEVGFTRYIVNFSVGYTSTRYFIINLSLSGTFNLFNESNGFPFGVYYNQSHGLINLSLQILCPLITYVHYVPAATSSFSLPLNCSYSKLVFFQDYPGQHYYRFLILTPDLGFNIPIYLLDFWQGGTYATPAVKITFMFEDLLSQYRNPVMYIDAIKNGTVQITADYINATSAATVYLQQNGVYNIRLESSNMPTYVIGEYVATDSETRVIRLYDINLNFTSVGYINNVEWGWGTGLSNTSYTNASYQDLYAFSYYNDSEFLTNNITLHLWADRYNGTLITPEYTIEGNAIYYILNISDYATRNVYGEILTWRNGSRFRYVGMVQSYERNIPEAFQYISTTFLDWFFMIFMSMLALSATISTGNFMALIIAGLALLFKAFGWLTISRYVIGIAMFISLIMFLRKNSKETE
jgi:hypothetical protein